VQFHAFQNLKVFVFQSKQWMTLISLHVKLWRNLCLFGYRRT